MKYICVDCGHIFEEGEEATIVEHHPYGDTTADEYIAVCPICGGDFEEAGICKCCGGAFYEDNLIAHYYCKECVEDYMTEENMKKYIKEDLDAFAEWMYDERSDN